MRTQLQKIYNSDYLTKSTNALISIGFAVTGSVVSSKVVNIARLTFHLGLDILSKQEKTPLLDLAAYSIAIISCGYGSYKFAMKAMGKADAKPMQPYVKVINISPRPEIEVERKNPEDVIDEIVAFHKGGKEL
jgi:hypothetical protein